MRAAIYARYSTDLQNPRSIADQVRESVDYCRRMGWTVVDTYADPEISGSTVILRPGVQALMAAAARRQFDIVLVEALDRISRNLGDTAKLREHLIFNQVALHTLSGEVTLMHVAFDGARNEMFIEDLKVKIRRGQRGNIAEGKSAGGLPYGYEIVREFGADGEPKRGLRRVRNDQAAIVRRIFGEYVAGISPFEIAKRLNVEGVAAKGGGPWSISTIGGHRQRKVGILHNEIYIGQLIHGRVTMTKNPATGKRISRPNAESTWRRMDVEDLRIIDGATWKSAQQKMLEHGGGDRGPMKPRDAHLLSGLVMCVVCGSNYVARDKAQLVCSGFYYRGTCENPRRIEREALEDAVLAQLARAMSEPEAFAANVKRLHDDMESTAADRGRARRAKAKELTDVRAKVGRVMEAIANGDGGQAPAAALRMVAELEGQQRRLERELEAMDESPVTQLRPNAHKIFAGQIANLRAELLQDAPTKARSMAILRSLIDRIEVTPTVNERGRPSFSWKIVGQLQEFLRLAVGNGVTPADAGNKAGTSGGYPLVAEERHGRIPPPGFELTLARSRGRR